MLNDICHICGDTMWTGHFFWMDDARLVIFIWYFCEMCTTEDFESLTMEEV